MLCFPMGAIGLGPIGQTCDHAAGHACGHRKPLTLYGLGGHQRFPFGLAEPDLIAAWFIGAPAKRLVLCTASHFTGDLAGHAAFVDLQDQAACRRRRDLGIDLAFFADVSGAWLAFRFRQLTPMLQRVLWIAVAAYGAGGL